MTDAPRQNILPSDVDAQGGVTLWDHGPKEYAPIAGDTPEQTAAKKEQRDREVAQWKAKNGDVPVVLKMHQSDAAHAMATDPGRYSMEPGALDEGEIEKRMKELKDKREAAVNGPQNALDRKAAIDAIMSDRRAAASAAAVKSTPDASVPASAAAPVQAGAPPAPDPHAPRPPPDYPPPEPEATF